MTPGIANGILNMSGQNTDHWMVYGILNIVAVVGVVMTDYLINIPTKKEKNNCHSDIYFTAPGRDGIKLYVAKIWNLSRIVIKYQMKSWRSLNSWNL